MSKKWRKSQRLEQTRLVESRTAESVQLIEYTQSGKPSRVDREKGVIYGVKVLGESSANAPPKNHHYPPATRKKALHMFEGLRVYIDHDRSGKERSYRDQVGMVRNPVDKPDGTYGDIHINPKHQLAEQIFWDAENNPNGLGMSINGNGDKRFDGTRAVVEDITSLESCDLVSKPATTNGLFEGKTMAKSTVKKLIESLKKTRPGISKALREVAEAGLMDMDTPMDEPAALDVGETADEGLDHESAIYDAITAVVNDTALSVADKLDKIKKLFAVIGEASPEGSAGEDGEETEVDKGPEGKSGSDGLRGSNQKGQLAAMNSDGTKGSNGDGGKGKNSYESTLAKQGNLIETLQRQLLSRDLCAESGVVPTKLLRRALEGCKTKEEMSELIEEYKREFKPATNLNGITPQKPKSAARAVQTPVQEGRVTRPAVAVTPSATAVDDDPPMDGEAFGKWAQN